MVYIGDLPFSQAPIVFVNLLQTPTVSMKLLDSWGGFGLRELAPASAWGKLEQLGEGSATYKQGSKTVRVNKPREVYLGGSWAAASYGQALQRGVVKDPVKGRPATPPAPPYANAAHLLQSVIVPWRRKVQCILVCSSRLCPRFVVWAVFVNSEVAVQSRSPGEDLLDLCLVREPAHQHLLPRLRPCRLL